MTKPKRGRPTKVDTAAAEKIIQALRSGAFREVAAAWAGISSRTFREWMTVGKENPTSSHGNFRRRVIEAETAAEIAVGTVAFEAASSDPDYALKYAAVRWRSRWNPAQKVEVSGPKGGPVQVSSEDLLAKLMKLEGATQ